MSDPGEGPVDALVTGAAGFIGRSLCARLEAEGATVARTDLRGAEVALDVTDAAAVRACFGRLRPRVVYHLAALVDDRGAAEAFERVNVGGTRAVVEALAADAGPGRLVQVSSIAALGLDPGPGASVASPLVEDAGAPYFDTKARSERVVRAAIDAGRISGVIVRPGDVYGPGSEPWVERPLAMMRAGQPVLIGHGNIAHTWVDNLVDALVEAGRRDAALGRTFIVTDGQSTPWRTYARGLARAAGVREPWVQLPVGPALVAAKAVERVSGWLGRPPPLTVAAVRYVSRSATYSIAEAREGLGYVPRVSLDEGFERLRPLLRAGVTRSRA